MKTVIKAVVITLILVISGIGGYYFNEQLKLKDELFAAVRANDMKAIDQALRKGASLDSQDGAGQTPLHVAAYNSDKDMLWFLIEKKPDINARDRRGGTPLHWAAVNGKTENVEVLLENGANPNAVDDGGMTPLFWIASGKKTHPIKKNLTARALLENDADPNIPNDRGRIPLDQAEQQGDKLMINLLRPLKK